MAKLSATRLLKVAALLILPFLIAAADWPTYLHDPQRSANGAGESALSPANANELTKDWTFTTSGIVAASPTVVSGTVYVGSWDGYEYALNASTGALQWKANLGITAGDECGGPPQGITSTATVQNGVVYVGGGDAYFYALNAGSGQILWRVNTGDNSPSGGHYIWSSPLVYNGYVYIGISSFGDCPIVQGQLLQVSLTTHQIVNTFNVVPNQQAGGGIWSSPSLDPATNTIYVTTGNPADPSQLCSQPFAPAIVALDANTLAVKGAWQVEAELSGDPDWGTTPILFNDRQGDALVAAVNKNGYLYAFNRYELGAGPVWQDMVAVGGDSPESGDASASSAAFGGSTLFQAAGNTTISGANYGGSVRAINPSGGQIVWEHGTTYPIVAPLAYANGLVIDGDGPTVEVLNARSGNLLYSYTTGGTIYSAASVSNGQIFVGSTDGNVYSFNIPANPATPTPTSTPSFGNGPSLGAGYSVSSQPATMLTTPAGGSVSYQITVTNTGTSPWPATGPNPVHLAVHFTPQGGGYPASLPWTTDQRIPLPYTLLPGNSITLQISVVPPTTPGAYTLEYQMVQEQVAWFPQYADSPVTVAATSATYVTSGQTDTFSPCSQPVYQVTITNTGSTVWQAGGADPVALEIHFAATTGGYPISRPWDDEQLFYLPSNVLPGHSVTLTVGVIAPSEPGSYFLEYQMQELGVGFFGQYLDSAVHVPGASPYSPISPPAATSTPTPVPGRSRRTTPTPGAGPATATPTPVPGRSGRGP